MKNKKGNMGIVIAFVVIACVIGLVIYALMNQNKELNSNVSENKILDNSTESNIETKGDKQVPETNTMEKISKNGDVLVMNYTGRLTDGTVFDSNVLPEFGHVEPFSFTLGAGQVIAGWDEGLVGMKVGEKKTLTIPPEKGYGSRAVGKIPANSTLVFDVELVGIE
jgi:FKBP-type peptidyl-prolyl cis-trans isomerase